MRYKLHKTKLCQNIFLDLLIYKYKFGHTSVDQKLTLYKPIRQGKFTSIIYNYRLLVQ